MGCTCRACMWYLCVHSLPGATVWGEFFQRWKVLPEKGGQAWPFVLLWDYRSWLPRALKAIPYRGHRRELPETKTKVSLTCPKSTQTSQLTGHRQLLGRPVFPNMQPRLPPLPGAAFSLFLPILPSFPVSSFFLPSANIACTPTVC